MTDIRGKLWRPRAAGLRSFGEGHLIATPVTGTTYVDPSGNIGVWYFADNFDRAIEAAFFVPDGFPAGVTAYADLWFYPPATGVGPNNIMRFRLGVSRQRAGQIAVADTTGDQDVTVGTIDIWQVATTSIVTTTWAQGDLIHVSAMRVGTSGNDTYPNHIYVAGLRLRY